MGSTHGIRETAMEKKKSHDGKLGNDDGWACIAPDRIMGSRASRGMLAGGLGNAAHERRNEFSDSCSE